MAEAAILEQAERNDVLDLLSELARAEGYEPPSVRLDATILDELWESHTGAAARRHRPGREARVAEVMAVVAAAGGDG